MRGSLPHPLGRARRRGGPSHLEPVKADRHVLGQSILAIASGPGKAGLLRVQVQGQSKQDLGLTGSPLSSSRRTCSGGASPSPAARSHLQPTVGERAIGSCPGDGQHVSGLRGAGRSLWAACIWAARGRPLALGPGIPYHPTTPPLQSFLLVRSHPHKQNSPFHAGQAHARAILVGHVKLPEHLLGLVQTELGGRGFGNLLRRPIHRLALCTQGLGPGLRPRTLLSEPTPHPRAHVGDGRAQLPGSSPLSEQDRPARPAPLARAHGPRGRRPDGLVASCTGSKPCASQFWKDQSGPGTSVETPKERPPGSAAPVQCRRA